MRSWNYETTTKADDNDDDNDDDDDDQVVADKPIFNVAFLWINQQFWRVVHAYKN